MPTCHLSLPYFYSPVMHFSHYSLQIKGYICSLCHLISGFLSPLFLTWSHRHPPPTTSPVSFCSERRGERAAAQSPAAHPQSSPLSLLLPEANRSSQTRSHLLASLLSLSHFLLLALHPPPPPSPISHLFLYPSPSSTLPFKSQEPLFSSPFPSSSMAPCVLSIF